MQLKLFGWSFGWNHNLTNFFCVVVQFLFLYNLYLTNTNCEGVKMSELNVVLQAILELSNKMDSLESRMSSLESKVGSLEEQSNKNQQIMIEKLDRINEQIMVLSHDSVTSKGDIRLLKKKIGLLDY